ncbi:MAG: serine--tRNA ligase [Candidatus Pacearchaeota archaeon]|jgi:seryl-tRNA synthetase
MIDINLIRENPTLVKNNIKKKFQDEKLVIVDEIKELDEKWKKLKFDEDQLRAERNKVSKAISELKKSGKTAKKELDRAKKIPDEIEKIEVKRKKIEEDIEYLLMQIPNIMHESVPKGKNSDENVEIRRIGSPKIFSFPVKNSAEIAEKINGVDFDSAREVSGNGFYYLEGDLALLHSAILSFARDYMVKNGFTYVIPPFMIREKIVGGVMSFEEKDNMMYKINNEDLYLIGTSEHSMIGRFIEKIISGKKLPFLLTSYSPCFRKEIGAHGMNEKGLYRLHQFEKQEMIVICEPEDSYKWYDKMIQLSLDIFKELEIPVRVFESCSGDLGDLKSKGADIEAWSPIQKKYYEIGSCSNLTDAQARRLNIRVDNKGKLYFAHTLNNTVVASPRILIALLENHQNKDGSINIPKVLQSYMQNKKKIEFKN